MAMVCSDVNSTKLVVPLLLDIHVVLSSMLSAASTRAVLLDHHVQHQVFRVIELTISYYFDLYLIIASLSMLRAIFDYL